jgi:hypothetical protein
MDSASFPAVIIPEITEAGVGMVFSFVKFKVFCVRKLVA